MAGLQTILPIPTTSVLGATIPVRLLGHRLELEIREQPPLGHVEIREDVRGPDPTPSVPLPGTSSGRFARKPSGQACLNWHRKGARAMTRTRRSLETLFPTLMFALMSCGCARPSPEVAAEPPPPPPVRAEPYLGLMPPGMEPEIFAPGLVSTADFEGCIVFSPDGTQMVFNRFVNRQAFTMLMKAEGAEWTGPHEAPIASPFYQGDFTVSPDGTAFYFSANWPSEEGGEPFEHSDIWVVDIDGAAWGEPRRVGPPISTDENHESYPVITRDGTLYYFAREPGEQADIFAAPEQDGGFGQPVRLAPPVNTEFEEYDPFLPPDGRYMVFASKRPGGLGSDDFYISFRRGDGSWGEAIHMGEPVSSAASENRPFVTLDGNYFFFTSTRENDDSRLQAIDQARRPGGGSRDIYWVDAAIIESFRQP
jgi:hypothetical protein